MLCSNDAQGLQMSSFRGQTIALVVGRWDGRRTVGRALAACASATRCEAGNQVKRGVAASSVSAFWLWRTSVVSLKLCK